MVSYRRWLTVFFVGEQSGWEMVLSPVDWGVDEVEKALKELSPGREFVRLDPALPMPGADGPVQGVLWEGEVDDFYIHFPVHHDGCDQRPVRVVRTEKGGLRVETRLYFRPGTSQWGDWDPNHHLVCSIRGVPPDVVRMLEEQDLCPSEREREHFHSFFEGEGGILAYTF